MPRQLERLLELLERIEEVRARLKKHRFKMRATDRRLVRTEAGLAADA